MKYLIHKGVKLPVVGLGTWLVGENPNSRRAELNCMLAAYRNGMFLLDTAEMYGAGNSERVVADAIKAIGRRNLFVVDKILPQNVTEKSFDISFQNSLRALDTDYIDLYLLHWRENVDLQFMVDKMESLVRQGKIRHWGVSNFDVKDMQDLFACKNGRNCFANQVLYNVLARGVEYDLLPYCKQNGVLVMAYSPLGSTLLDRKTMDDRFYRLCDKAGVCTEAMMLAFAVRSGEVVALFKTKSLTHLTDNLAYIDCFDSELLQQIDSIYPAPTHKVKLETI